LQVIEFTRLVARLSGPGVNLVPSDEPPGGANWQLRGCSLGATVCPCLSVADISTGNWNDKLEENLWPIWIFRSDGEISKKSCQLGGVIRVVWPFGYPASHAFPVAVSASRAWL
jgi:hypothetical protein